MASASFAPDLLVRRRIIGRFYNGRDHSTVCYGIQRIETLRETDPEVDALITNLKRQLTGEHNTATLGIGSGESVPLALSQPDLENLAELIAVRVCAYIEKRTQASLREPEADRAHE